VVQPWTGSSTHRHAANEQYGTESLGISLEKKAELYSSSTYELVRADFLADVLQHWRTFTKAQKALFFLKYDGKVYAGMLSIG
jgi:hypothetical protein